MEKKQNKIIAIVSILVGVVVLAFGVYMFMCPKSNETIFTDAFSKKSEAYKEMIVDMDGIIKNASILKFDSKISYRLEDEKLELPFLLYYGDSKIYGELKGEDSDVRIYIDDDNIYFANGEKGKVYVLGTDEDTKSELPFDVIENLMNIDVIGGKVVQYFMDEIGSYVTNDKIKSNDVTISVNGKDVDTKELSVSLTEKEFLISLKNVLNNISKDKDAKKSLDLIMGALLNSVSFGNIDEDYIDYDFDFDDDDFDYDYDDDDFDLDFDFDDDDFDFDDEDLDFDDMLNSMSTTSMDEVDNIDMFEELIKQLDEIIKEADDTKSALKVSVYTKNNDVVSIRMVVSGDQEFVVAMDTYKNSDNKEVDNIYVTASGVKYVDATITHVESNKISYTVDVLSLAKLDGTLDYSDDENKGELSLSVGGQEIVKLSFDIKEVKKDKEYDMSLRVTIKGDESIILDASGKLSSSNELPKLDTGNALSIDDMTDEDREALEDTFKKIFNVVYNY